MTMLRKTTIFRADTQNEINSIIEEALADGGELTKKTVETKTKKQKGEIIDECFKVTIQVDYADIWNPDGGEDEV